jgi:hypothetical protein
MMVSLLGDGCATVMGLGCLLKLQMEKEVRRSSPMTKDGGGQLIRANSGGE